MWISRSTKLATQLGCPTSAPAKLEDCLQKADPGSIIAKQYEVLTKPTILALPFVPVVDGDFLPDEVEVGVCVCAFVYVGGVGRYVEQSLGVNVPLEHKIMFCFVFLPFISLSQLDWLM